MARPREGPGPPSPRGRGPGKSMWGREQREWLKRTLHESDALFKVLISPTPLVGPDRTNKRDNHSNAMAYKTEGTEFLNWIRENSIHNFYSCNGDRHWQYHSIHPTGHQEFSVGAMNRGNLAAVPPCPPEIQRPYAESTPGFLHVRVLAEGADARAPRIVFELRSDEGKINYSLGQSVRPERP